MLHVDDKLKERLKTYLYSEGKTLKGALQDEVDYIVDNNLPIGKPVEIFFDIRERLINKYGTLKNAAEIAGIRYQNFMDVIYKIEQKKDYRPSKSTISKLSELLEK